MASLEKFYENMKVLVENDELIIKLKPLFDDVIKRIPEEPQFQIKALIMFGNRNYIVDRWNQLDPKMEFAPDMRPANRDGNCKMFPTVDGEIKHYIISIVTDMLYIKSEDYIKGLIIHELSEMSLAWRQLEKEKPSFLKMSLKAKQVIINRIFGSNLEIESVEYFEKEKEVNAEAIRLGFEKEINALESSFSI